ncbi:MAG: DNA polymerase III subunit gamma/tau [Ilumatobacteraceae bacterium]
MAVQSLYRRYRPRRFSELRGQDHIVRALRNAVVNEREGQAYLFSGPRGTGKTSTARILAKVLNCEAPIDGEPCCACASCVAVESGTSYDVIELDAASNNGVDDVRDLIDRAGLGSPGRHRVFILDEVHMLSKAAEAALLKTLEEPPSHVVFVLATTDPQKVSETIRSRTQHLQFHLLPMHDLEEHVRFVVADAGLEVTDAAIEQVLVQGGGSARDTLSALELVAAAGGDVEEAVDLDEFIEAIIDGDPGRALAAVAFAVQQGRDPRTLGEQLVRHLREAFLTQMAPELVQLPAERAEHVAAWARRLGNGSIVRAMEAIGDTLIAMRHAPDARLLLEVSLMKLCSPGDSGDVSGLVVRLERLERAVASGAAAAPASPPPVDPMTGRAKLGGAAKPVVDTPRAAPEPTLVKPAVMDKAPAVTDKAPAVMDKAPAVMDKAPAVGGNPADLWPQVLTSLKPLVRALYSACSVSSPTADTVVLSAPNAVHQMKCNEHAATVAAAFEKLTGRKVGVNVDVGDAPKDRSAPRKKKANAVSDEIPHDDIDPDELSDMPIVPIESALDRISRSFPGSKVIDESDTK